MSRSPGAYPDSESILEKYFLPSERIAENVRLHWSVIIEPFLSAMGSLIIAFYIVGNMSSRGGVFDDALILAAFGMIMRLVYRVLEWDFDRFIVTNRRIALVQGLLWSRKVAMMPLERVTDMTYSQSAAGRLFGWGTFVVESAGQEQALRTVDRIPSPDRLYRTMLTLLFAPKAPAKSGQRSPWPPAELPPPRDSDGS
ncbi:MAG: PH domain-containing protein [Mycobacteriales bacterium]